MEDTKQALSKAKKGSQYTVVAVNDDYARIQALRFGIGEGALVKCIAKIPAGPIVLRSGHQEIAIGRDLAHRITVAEVK